MVDGGFMVLTTTFFQNNLIEILMSLVLLFNLTAFKVIWEQIKKEKGERRKNTESINMIVNRIFGIEQDPTDEGYLSEAEDRFQNINTKLDRIADRQREAVEERKKDHEEVREAINYIIEELSEEEQIDFDGKKL